MKNEKHTRKEIIDNRLKQAGWIVGDRSQVVEEFDIMVDKNLVQEALTPYAGHQFSDYVLLGKDGKPLAVVEAKKTLLMPQLAENKQNNIAKHSDKHKAENYPSAFYTNGHDIFFGTWIITPQKKFMGFQPVMIWNATNTSARHGKL
ncbi:MAG: hypothetical protein IPI52_14390 [Bacteroidetes bacterium]|nr:hypothetical protein [Bacteroidota bacterium]